jgi:hypothetical protein
VKRPIPASNFSARDPATLDDLRRVRQTQKEILDWIDAQIGEIPETDLTPYSTTVQSDLAYLKRADSDWSGFTTQAPVVGGDKLLIERASDSAKRVVTASNFALPADRTGFPYLQKPSNPDAWNLETRDWTDPDIAANGWTIHLLDSPWTVQTRAGDIDMNSNPSANTYRSTLAGGLLNLQFPIGTFVTIYKTTTAAAFTYAGRAWASINLASNANTSVVALSDNTHRLAVGARHYYSSMEATTQLEVTLVGPGTFGILGTGAPADNQFDTIKYLHYTAAGNIVAAHSHAPYSGRLIQNMSGSYAPTNRTFALTPTIAGLWMGSGLREIFHVDFLRRYPLWTHIPT